MSTSKTDICNLAIYHIGSSDTITSLTQTPATETSRACNAMYDISRQFVLQDHEWGFAELREDLALLSLTPVGYEYAYQYPIGCLQGRNIYQSVDGEKPIDFAVMSQSTLTSRMILTNEENAKLVYTGDIEDTNMFSPAFIMAFSYQLAANIAIPITKKTSVKDRMLAYYSVYKDKADILDAKENEYTTIQNNDFLTARSYSG
jgi:hypothetical protein